jgi:DNA-binding NarL/FixJ family response regulator
MINVILADHQRIFRIGMASALAAEDDIRIVGQPHSISQLLHGLENFRAHVLVLSSAFLGKLADIKRIADRQHTAILLLEEPGTVMVPQFSTDVNGVMQRSADESTVVRCVRHLARGGRVLRLVRNQTRAHHLESVSLRGRHRLSQLELRITALVVQGRKNREIALHLGSTEQGIKNSLRRIFDKTGVFDRLELALFVLHHGIVVRGEADSHQATALNSLAAVQAFRDMEYRRTVN